MKSMSDAAGLTGRHTNYSVRRTMISTLRKENVEPINIIGEVARAGETINRRLLKNQQLYLMQKVDKYLKKIQTE